MEAAEKQRRQSLLKIFKRFSQFVADQPTLKACGLLWLDSNLAPSSGGNWLYGPFEYESFLVQITRRRPIFTLRAFGRSVTLSEPEEMGMLSFWFPLHPTRGAHHAWLASTGRGLAAEQIALIRDFIRGLKYSEGLDFNPILDK